MKIVIINGSARSGKDTFCEMVGEYAEKGTLSTVGAVKHIARQYFGWNGIKDEKGRQLLSDIKDTWTKYCNGPFNVIASTIKSFKCCEPDVEIVFVHCREPEEIQKFKDYYGDDCTTLLIRRPGIEVPGNHADQLVEEFQYDTIILNDKGLNELNQKAKDFINQGGN